MKISGIVHNDCRLGRDCKTTIGSTDTYVRHEHVFRNYCKLF